MSGTQGHLSAGWVLSPTRSHAGSFGSSWEWSQSLTGCARVRHPERSVLEALSWAVLPQKPRLSCESCILDRGLRELLRALRSLELHCLCVPVRAPVLSVVGAWPHGWLSF